MAQGECCIVLIHICGAILIILGCGSIGFLASATHKCEEKTLRQFISALDYMECEVQYDLTPLPELCRRTAQKINGPLRCTFQNLASELDSQISPDVESCVIAAIHKTKHLPRLSRQAVKLLGISLGSFDLDGQLASLRTVRNETKHLLEIHTSNQDARLRSYQALGLCTGAAIAILLI